MKWMLSNNQDPYQQWNRHHPVVPFRRYKDECIMGMYNPNEWYDVSEFTESLHLESYYSSSNSCGFSLKDNDGFTYNISMNDFFPLIEVTDISNGWTESLKWTFKKVGQSYLLTTV